MSFQFFSIREEPHWEQLPLRLMDEYETELDLFGPLSDALMGSPLPLSSELEIKEHPRIPEEACFQSQTPIHLYL